MYLQNELQLVLELVLCGSVGFEASYAALSDIAVVHFGFEKIPETDEVEDFELQCNLYLGCPVCVVAVMRVGGYH